MCEWFTFFFMRQDPNCSRLLSCRTLKKQWSHRSLSKLFFFLMVTISFAILQGYGQKNTEKYIEELKPGRRPKDLHIWMKIFETLEHTYLITRTRHKEWAQTKSIKMYHRWPEKLVYHMSAMERKNLGLHEEYIMKATIFKCKLATEQSCVLISAASTFSPKKVCAILWPELVLVTLLAHYSS